MSESDLPNKGIPGLGTSEREAYEVLGQYLRDRIGIEHPLRLFRTLREGSEFSGLVPIGLGGECDTPELRDRLETFMRALDEDQPAPG